MSAAFYYVRDVLGVKSILAEPNRQKKVQKILLVTGDLGPLERVLLEKILQAMDCPEVEVVTQAPQDLEGVLALMSFGVEVTAGLPVFKTYALSELTQEVCPEALLHKKREVWVGIQDFLEKICAY